MKRPIFIASIAYITGIFLGIYLPKSIFLFFMLISLLVLLKLCQVRIVNTIFKYIFLFFIMASLAILITSKKNESYNKFKVIDNCDVTCVGTIISEISQKENNRGFIIKVEKIEVSNDKGIRKIINVQNCKMKVILKKSENILEYADKIKVMGTYLEPESSRNYQGFNYKEYLKTQDIYGIINSFEAVVIKHKNVNSFSLVINKISSAIKKNLKEHLSEETYNLAIGILLGDKLNIDENIIENFKSSNLSHMLAVSGTHVAYVILTINILFNKKYFGRNKQYLFSIFILIIFSILTGNTPSVNRAVLTYIIYVVAKLINRKSDVINAISISILCTLFINPFSLFNIGMQLSYAGTIGILLYNPSLISKVNTQNKIVKYVLSSAVLSISANIFIIPIMIYQFNVLSTTFILSNLCAGSVLGITIIVEILFSIISIIPNPISDFISFILSILLRILLKVAESFSKIPNSNITVTTPNIITAIIAYIILISLYFFLKKKIKKKLFLKLISLLISIILIFNSITILVNNEKFIIHFIDVGQGDSTLLITKCNKKVLIDGGGSSNSDFDVGEKTLLPYLLDRKINNIDYIMVSHFDDDHCDGLKAVIKKIKVKNIVISKQASICDEYKEIINMCKLKNINIIIVKRGSILTIDKYTYFEILHPGDKLLDDGKGGLNANAIVAKLHYENAKVSNTILFTGDIEEKSERELINIFGAKLKSNILKVAHHGSKTSSTKEFLELVNPNIALIGVGKNNKFGHPNDEVIERMEILNIKVYRTDLNGEITIDLTSGKVKPNAIRTHIAKSS